MEGLTLEDDEAKDFSEAEGLARVVAGTAAVIVVHRTGDNGSGAQVEFASSAVCDGRFELDLAAAGAYVTYPTIRVRAVAGLDEMSTAIDAGCAQIMLKARNLMDEHGIPAERIFVGGFDAGGLLALHLCARLPIALGGFFCLSGGGQGMTDSASLPELLKAAGQRRIPTRIAIGIEQGGVSSERLLESVAEALESSAPVTTTTCWRLGAEEELDELVPRQVELTLNWLLKQLGEAASEQERREPPSAKTTTAKKKIVDPKPSWVLSQDLEQAGYTRCVFSGIPLGSEELITRYPISCRGAAFALESEGPGQVRCVFYSPQPEATAEAIASRIAVRCRDPDSSGAEACLVA